MTKFSDSLTFVLTPKVIQSGTRDLVVQATHCAIPGGMDHTDSDVNMSSGVCDSLYLVYH